MKNILIIAQNTLLTLGIEILEKVTVTETENIMGIIAQFLIILYTTIKIYKTGNLNELPKKTREKLLKYIVNIFNYFKNRKNKDV